MRKIRNRLNVENLFVLGAGASFSASYDNTEFNNYNIITPETQPHPKIAPLDKDFCKRIVNNVEVKTPEWYSDAISYLKADWKDNRELSQFGLEEAIITQIGFYKFYKDIYKRTNTKSEFDFLSGLIRIISCFLSQCKESNKKLYKKLFSLYETNKDNRVISFNYDLLLDFYFIKKYKNPKNIYFSEINLKKSDHYTKSTQKNNYYPLLLKLHGSINWFISAENLKSIIEHSQIDNTMNIVYEKNVNKNLNLIENYPCIIPPIPSKPITNISIFKDIWSIASEYLSQAKRIIIYGYSLPKIDNLAVSLFGSFKNKEIEEVIVIDPDPLVFKRWKIILTRDSINNHIRWSYFLSFKEFYERERK